jgi:hypothetical protein
VTAVAPSELALFAIIIFYVPPKSEKLILINYLINELRFSGLFSSLILNH